MVKWSETVIKGHILVDVLEHNVTLHAAQMNLITSLLILSTGKFSIWLCTQINSSRRRSAVSGNLTRLHTSFVDCTP